MSPLALALLIVTEALALSLAIRARAPWTLRAASVVLVLGAAFAIWSAAGDEAGWPVRADFPDKNVFLGCVVQEPAQGFDGAIYLWLVPPGGSSNPLASTPAQGEPRAYAEPYSLELEAACQQAQKIVGSGGQAGIRHAKKKHSGSRNSRGGSSGGPEVRIRAYRLPPPHPPSKGTP